jgi:hypothetical protein
VALVLKRTIPTKRPLLVGEVSGNSFLRIEGVAWSAQRIITAVNLDFLDLNCVHQTNVGPINWKMIWKDMRPILIFFYHMRGGTKETVTNNNQYDRPMDRESDKGIPLTLPRV